MALLKILSVAMLWLASTAIVQASGRVLMY